MGLNRQNPCIFKVFWIYPYYNIRIVNGQPQDVSVPLGAIGATKALSVGASSPDGGALTYQWYSCNADGSNAATIIGGTLPSFSIQIDVIDTCYYYVVVTNTLGDSMASTTSRIAAVTVMPAATLKSANTSIQAKVGGKQQLNITYTGTGTLTYVSSNTPVCTVSATGLITALKAGNSVITISAPDAPSITVMVMVTN